MREFYEKYFYIPKHGTMKEKAFLASITVSVISIVLILSAMGFTAYAFFTANAVSSGNSITSGSLEMNCTVKNETDNLIEAENKTEFPLTVEGKASKNYSIHLDLKETSTVSTGFCMITITYTEENEVQKFYYTNQLWKEEVAAENKYKQMDFQIILNKDATISITPYWGTSTLFAQNNIEGNEFFVMDGEVITIGTATMNVTTQESSTEESVTKQTPLTIITEDEKVEEGSQEVENTEEKISE